MRDTFLRFGVESDFLNFFTHFYVDHQARLDLRAGCCVCSVPKVRREYSAIQTRGKFK